MNLYYDPIVPPMQKAPVFVAFFCADFGADTAFMKNSGISCARATP